MQTAAILYPSVVNVFLLPAFIRYFITIYYSVNIADDMNNVFSFSYNLYLQLKKVL